MTHFDGDVPLGLSTAVSGFATLIAALWTSQIGFRIYAALLGSTILIVPVSTAAFALIVGDAIAAFQQPLTRS